MESKTNEIIQYLENIILIEKNLYQLKDIEKHFDHLIRKYTHVEYEYEKRYKENTFTKVAIIIVIITFLISSIAGCFSHDEFGSSSFMGALIGGSIITIPIGILFLILGIIIAKNTKDENTTIRSENQEIEKRNKIKRETQQSRLGLLNKNKAIIRQKIRETESIRHTFYSKNIIYSKYWNIVAICSFYEYFKSGRCDSLTGHEGAYNIYENEIRLNIINDKLDSIIYKLDNIQNNQFSLYNAIKESNYKINQICNNTNRIVEQLDNIETNTYITSYTSSITAINSTCQAWLMNSLLKEIKD